MMTEKLDPDPLENSIEKKNKLMENTSKIFKMVFGIKSSSSFEESVSELIREHHTDASVHEEEKTILQNIITFGDLEADDIMVTRTDIIAAPDTVKFEELEAMFVRYSHSRIAIYRESIDNIIGFVHLKDFFRSNASRKEFNLNEIIREVIYVPASIKITDLLSRMKTSSVHIAIVLDEYGGTDGLITIEDIVRKVLGEINDEYAEQGQGDMIRFDDDHITIDAKAKIEEVSKALKVNLSVSNADYDTFGGFVITFLGRIPQKGELISHPSGLNLEIMDANNRKIKLIKVTQGTKVK